MSLTTFIVKNFDSGLLHAYRYTGSHFERRCGSTGTGEFVSGGDEVTEVSATWFVQQSDACRKCKNTFELDADAKSTPDENLHKIASKYAKGTGINTRKTSVEADSSTTHSVGSGEISCPVPSCEYTGPVASVAAHVSGKKDAEHDWGDLGFEGANDFKRTMGNS